MSFTAQFTQIHGLKILDENEDMINSFNYIKNETDWSQLKPIIPTLIVDRFANKEVVIDLKETETINNYPDLKRMGFVVISQRVPHKDTWFKGQSRFFRLCSINNIPTDCTIYDSIPKTLFIRYDYVNNLIRLEDKDRGRQRHKNYNTTRRGCGDWYQIKKT